MALDDQSSHQGAAGVEDDIEVAGSIIAGRYKLLEWIGDGGMGRVYRATQMATGRSVALKMMQADSFGEEARRRFHKEATIASRLNHPNAIAIYDFGGTSNDQLYLVMEYVDGVSLDRMIQKSGCLSPPQVIEIFSQICELLSEAHSLGIIHRDLKPSNIMLTQNRTGKNVVKVLDFGIAKQLQMNEQGLTSPGQIFGSPLYMSPEQCTGSTVTQATDIYSIGCMLYESLSGTPPFTGDNAFGTMEMHRNKQAARFKDIRPDLAISPALEAIVLRCLKKNPSERFASAADLLSALQVLTQEPIGHRGRVKSYALFAVPIIASLLLCFACFSWLMAALKSTGQSPQVQGNSEQNKQQLPTATKESIDDQMIKIAGEYDLGTAAMNNGETEKAIHFFSDTISLAQATLQQFKDDYRALRMLGMASQQRGYLYSQAGRYKEAIRDLSVAIEIRPGYRGNYMNRAAAYKKLGRLKLAQTDIEMYNKLPELEKNAVTGWSARAMRPPVHAR